MALKIEFSAAFKDSETTLKVLHELNKEMHALSESAQGVGGSSAKAFEEMKRQISDFEKSTSAVKGLKDLNKELQQLAGMQSGIQNFGRSFTELGKAMNQGLGMATDTLVNNFKQKLEGLRFEADDTAKKLQESLGKLDDTLITNQQRKQYQGEAKQYSTMLGQQQSDIKESERMLMMNQPRGVMAGYSIAQAMGVMPGVASVLSMAPQVVEGAESMRLSGYRGQIRQRALSMQAAQEAQGGDPSLLLAQQMGLGEEAGYNDSGMKEWDKHRGKLSLAGMAIGAASLIAAPFTGGMSLVGGLSAAGAIAGGAYSYKSGEEAQAERLAGYRSMDMQMYSKLWTPGQTRYSNIYESNKDLLLSQGDRSTMATLEAANMAGIADKRALPAMDLMDLYGQKIGGEYKQSVMKRYDETTGQYIADRSKYAATDKTQIYKIQQDLGLGQGAMTELVKQGGTDNATRSLDLALGNSDLTNRRAMSSLAESYAQITGKSATGFAEPEGAFSTVNAAVQAIKRGGKVADIDAARVGGEIGVKVQNMFGDPTSLLGSAVDNNLIQMGVSDPAQRLTIRKEMEAGNTGRASRLVSGLTGRKVGDVTTQLQSTRERVAQNIGSILGDSPQAKAVMEAEYGVGTSFTDVMTGGIPGATSALTGAISGRARAGTTPATAGKALTEAEAIEKAGAEKGGTELQVLRETTEKLGTAISRVIGDSFRKLGDQLINEGQNASKQAEERRSAPTPKPNTKTPRAGYGYFAQP